MTTPTRETRLTARTDADFRLACQRFLDHAQTLPLDLDGWTLRFVVKVDPGANALIEIADGAIARDDEANGRFTVLIDKAVLAGALPSGVSRVELVYALQAEGPAGESEVWAAGSFTLHRGL